MELSLSLDLDLLGSSCNTQLTSGGLKMTRGAKMEVNPNALATPRVPESLTPMKVALTK